MPCSRIPGVDSTWTILSVPVWYNSAQRHVQFSCWPIRQTGDRDNHFSKKRKKKRFLIFLPFLISLLKSSSLFNLWQTGNLYDIFQSLLTIDHRPSPGDGGFYPSILSIIYCLTPAVSPSRVPVHPWWMTHYTLRRFFPFRRLRLITALPPLLDIRALNPWVRFLFRLFGWYVRFTSAPRNLNLSYNIYKKPLFVK